MHMVAHRGSSYVAPENTLAALKLAFRQGAKGVEFDIQRSKDGEVFLLHDSTLRRTATQECPDGFSQEEYNSVLDKNVCELNYWDCISRMDVGGRKGAEYVGERCCLMEEAMATLPSGCFALCEVKGGDVATAKAVATLVKAKEWTGESLVFIGFDLKVMKELKATLVEQGQESIKVILVSEARSEGVALEAIGVAKCAGLDGVDFEADTAVVTKGSPGCTCGASHAGCLGLE